MSEISKDELHDLVRDAVREAMAEKFELTFGIDCRSADERMELRDDFSFLRTIRTQAQKGGERIFYWAIGIAGTGLLAWFWPDISKFGK